MPVVYTRCCGLDVHKASITACVLVFDEKKNNNEERIKSFGTTTGDLIRLRCWLKSSKVTQVAMESTGVYWKPVWHELLPHFQLTLVNPVYVKQRRGHKTDQNDSRWIAGQLQVDDLRGSYVPDQETQDLRDLTRYRTSMVQDSNRAANRIHHLLEDMGIKFSCVATDILGKTGRLIFDAIIRGQTDPGWLADYAQTALRGKKKELEAALRGHIREHHKQMLSRLLEDYDGIRGRIQDLEETIRKRMEPHAEVIQRLCEVPGIDEVACWTFLAEGGFGCKAFGSAGQFASWAGVCPGNHQSAGTRKKVATLKGNRFLRRMLIQCAWSGTRKKQSFFKAFYGRKTARLGPLKALVALAHRMAVIIYNILNKHENYRELGGSYYDLRNPIKTARRLTQRLEELGYRVEIRVRDEGPKPVTS
jgi:transposase